MKIEQYLKEKKSLIEQALTQYLPPKEQFPPLIHQALHYSVFTGGKRLRPILLLATAEAVDGEIEELLPAACAIECIHTYSLIHDDLPAMDNDDFRRGKPTCHKVFGEGIAILA
ncbi:MAG TPA: polyprenyl synthetase family protein, partial [Clostridia bacterium]|nr:polyprenyl synthetase family protein [Clostridia bacterium]